MSVFLRILATVLACVCPASVMADVVITGASISASGSAGGGRGAAMAADGNPDTRWTAPAADPGQWLTLEFEKPALIRAVRVSEPRPRIRGWRIEVLGNGTWRTAAQGTGIPRDKILLPLTWAEGVRMVTTTPADGAPEVSEFAAWGSGTSACVPQAGNQTVTVAGDLDCAGLAISLPCNRNGPVAALFMLADGARLRNVTLLDTYVSCEGACTLENVNWRNTCGSIVQASAMIQSLSNQGPRDVSIVGGSAFGRYGALFRMNVAGSTLHLRQFVFSGYSESLNAWPHESSMGLRYKLDEVQLAGTIRGAVIQVRLDKGDQASIRRMRIAGYRMGSPVVCSGLSVVNERLISSGDLWQSDACDVGPDDVVAIPR